MVPQWIDRALENDKAAAIGAALVFLVLVAMLAAGVMPEAHKEAAGSIAAAAGAFSLAAFRRAGAPKRRALSREPEQ